MLGDITDAVLNATGEHDRLQTIPTRWAEFHTMAFADPAEWDRDLLVEDCTIANIPVEYTGATGLFAGYVSGLTVQHNLFANQSYSAMTIGWGWGRTGSGRGNNTIRANRIERPTTVRCCDGGGIYTLGPQPGSHITANYLVDRSPPLGSSNCIYHDNGSGGWTDTENLCEGHWNDLAINGKLGDFGPCGTCPSFEPGIPGDCSIHVTKNWFQTYQSKPHRGGGCKQVRPTLHFDVQKA